MTRMSIERLEGCRALSIRCLNTGTFCRWTLTEAQGGTFIDAEFGMDPENIPIKAFDRIAGGLRAGSYRFTATYPGCTPDSARVTVAAGQTLEQDFHLSC